MPHDALYFETVNIFCSECTQVLLKMNHGFATVDLIVTTKINR